MSGRKTIRARRCTPCPNTFARTSCTGTGPVPSKHVNMLPDLPAAGTIRRRAGVESSLEHHSKLAPPRGRNSRRGVSLERLAPWIIPLPQTIYDEPPRGRDCSGVPSRVKGVTPPPGGGGALPGLLWNALCASAVSVAPSQRPSQSFPLGVLSALGIAERGGLQCVTVTSAKTPKARRSGTARSDTPAGGAGDNARDFAAREIPHFSAGTRYPDYERG